LGSELLGKGLEHLQRGGAGEATIWAYGDRLRTVAWLERLGFVSCRLLFGLHRPAARQLAPQWPPDWSVRSFRPCQDEEAWHALHLSLQTDPSQAWSVAALRRQLRHPETPPDQFWLLCEKERLRGYVWRKRGQPCELFLFAVDPAIRGQGMGRRLLEWALSQGDGSAFVYCDEHRQAALALYRSAGFSEVGRDRCLRKTM
jgi:mycothiol synthase